MDISDLTEAADGVLREELASRGAVLAKRLGLDGHVLRLGNRD